MQKSGQLLEIDEVLDVWRKLEVNAPSIGLYWPFWFSYPATMLLNDFGYFSARAFILAFNLAKAKKQKGLRKCRREKTGLKHIKCSLWPHYLYCNSIFSWEEKHQTSTAQHRQRRQPSGKQIVRICGLNFLYKTSHIWRQQAAAWREFAIFTTCWNIDQLTGYLHMWQNFVQTQSQNEVF